MVAAARTMAVGPWKIVPTLVVIMVPAARPMLMLVVKIEVGDTGCSPRASRPMRRRRLMLHAPYRRTHGLRELRHSAVGLPLSHFFCAGYSFRFRITVGATRARSVLTVDVRYFGKISG